MLKYDLQFTQTSTSSFKAFIQNLLIQLHPTLHVDITLNKDIHNSYFARVVSTPRNSCFARVISRQLVASPFAVLTKPGKNNGLHSVSLSNQHLGGRVGLLESANLGLDKLSQRGRRRAVLAQVESDFSECCGHCGSVCDVLCEISNS